jgi:hypothetical protein
MSRDSNGIRAERLGFFSWQGRDIFLLCSVHTGPEATQLLAPYVSGGAFPADNKAED